MARFTVEDVVQTQFGYTRIIKFVGRNRYFVEHDDGSESTVEIQFADDYWKLKPLEWVKGTTYRRAGYYDSTVTAVDDQGNALLTGVRPDRWGEDSKYVAAKKASERPEWTEV